jgi:hypothetical protein
MFGFGNRRRRTQNDTFSPNRIRGAAIAGLGMLAWRMWRNRQETSRRGTSPNRPFSETSRRPSSDTF